MPKNILITGGTGLVGTRLTKLLIGKGCNVRYLSRSPEQSGPVPMYKWDVKEGTIDERALDDVDTIVHLAGAGIADKAWSKERKKVILESRTESTALLYETLKNVNHQVEHFISASAVGYYGNDSGGILKQEDSRFGDDFLATVTKAWETEVDNLKSLNGMKVSKLRFGVILSDKGGALEKMVQPIKLGLGAPLGSGDQYISWIHINDLCRMIWHTLEHSLTGPYNAVAPDPVTNKTFTKTAANVLSKPCFLPNVPAFVLKLVLGERASIVLGGNKVSSEKIESSGFAFEYAELKEALTHLLKN